MNQKRKATYIWPMKIKCREERDMKKIREKRIVDRLYTERGER